LRIEIRESRVKNRELNRECGAVSNDGDGGGDEFSDDELSDDELER
jgi:hypothetical protein